MKIILSGRGQGKMSRLIKMSSETDAIIVCSHAEKIRTVMYRAEDMRLQIPTPITYSQLCSGKWKGHRVTETLNRVFHGSYTQGIAYEQEPRFLIDDLEH